VRFSRISLLSLFGLLGCALGASACESKSTIQNPVPDGGGGNAGGAGGSPVVPQPVKVLNWNLHKLIDDETDGYPAEQVVTTAVWDAHRQAVGKVIAAADPDIAILQEVEGMDVLQALDDEELGGSYTVLELAPGNDPSGIAVAMLSRIPVDEVITHEDDTFTVAGTPAPSYQYSRDCLELHFTINGRKLGLFGVHYKAKVEDDPDKRLAEAQHTRSLADAYTSADPEAGALILGDFNDTPGSLAVNWTIGNPPNQYTDAPESVAAADRWTMVYNGNQELVDHQMSSPVLASMLRTSSVQIIHSTDVDHASDHAPVIAIYDVE
jgi:endonuclease/exonuclease/phosphatase family metal-dependent hydrolase